MIGIENTRDLLLTYENAPGKVNRLVSDQLKEEISKMEKAYNGLNNKND